MSVVVGADGRPRCAWCAATPDYVAYHDAEWGVPVADDRVLFEKLTLEGFQAGLSWRTILEKRAGFRAAFAGFEIAAVAAFGPADAARLLADPGIVRHQGKIAAAIGNAARALALIAETGSLAAHVWSFAPSPAEAAAHRGASSTPASTALSADLKRRGWRFVGPTTVYAFMQAAGMVNDHADACFRRAEVEGIRAGFKRPGR